MESTGHLSVRSGIDDVRCRQEISYSSTLSLATFHHLSKPRNSVLIQWCATQAQPSRTEPPSFNLYCNKTTWRIYWKGLLKNLPGLNIP
jgi:hypothetical protein